MNTQRNPSELRKRRLRRYETASEVARRLKVSRAHYTKIEQGVVSPSLELAVRIAQQFDAPVEELFPGGRAA